MIPKTKSPKTALAKAASRALKRAAARARMEARRYGTSIHVQSGRTVLALKP
jgi:hypothetical protein